MVTKKNIDTLESLWKNLKRTSNAPDQKWLKRCQEIIHSTPSRTLVFSEVMERLYRVSEKMSILGREDLEVPLVNACKNLERNTISLKEEFLYSQFLTVLLELSRNPLEIPNSEPTNEGEDLHAETESRLLNEELSSLGGDHWEEPDWMEITSEEEELDDSTIGDTHCSTPARDEGQKIDNTYADDPYARNLQSLNHPSIPYDRKEAIASFRRVKPFMFFDGSSDLEGKNISERWFMKDVIYMLHGLPSSFFQICDDGTIEVRHQILPKVNSLTQKSVYSVLDVFASHGSCLTNYRNLLKDLAEANVGHVNLHQPSEIVRKEIILPYLKEPLETCLAELQKRLHGLEYEIYCVSTKSTLFQAYMDLSPIIFCLKNYLEIINASTTVWDVMEKLDVLKQQKHETDAYNYLFKSSCVAVFRWLYQFANRLHVEKVPRYMKQIISLMKQPDFEKDYENFLKHIESSFIYENALSFAEVLVQLEICFQTKKLNISFWGIENKSSQKNAPLLGLSSLIHNLESAKCSLLLKQKKPQWKVAYGHYVLIQTCLNYIISLHNEMQTLLVDAINVNTNSSFFKKEIMPVRDNIDIDGTVEQFLQDVFTEDVLEILQIEESTCKKDVFASVMERRFSTKSGSVFQSNEVGQETDELCNIFVKLSRLLLHPDRPVDPAAYCCRRRFSELLLLIIPEV
ncbi:gamma tubulin complex subunit Mod21 [Schizosaccharomyces octosporus yFS286]|uniref:Gamma tubulin complex subunit Mod21 n=1 Tax=Schizosaccharomyces octosporus (strain yFS286) TaxID=483514 RepID=S9PUD6_SCHOY|nr:gamma tubulin complex subunit Mod21 [Schizosaccharomyces octosporus yFS286]EPX72756.1 gamma tubulin complex subunit Mod21 [Schizosaccharomyces octosporus yFS286]